MEDDEGPSLLLCVHARPPTSTLTAVANGEDFAGLLSRGSSPSLDSVVGEGVRDKMIPRNRRGVTGRTNLKQHQEQETKASLERKRQAKEREKREKEKEKALMAKPKSQDDEVVDSLIVDLRERFYEKGSLAKSFRGMDYDESGGISLDEFSTFFKNMGHNLTPQQFKILLSRTDHDQSNTMDLEEFCSSFDILTSVTEEQGFSNVNTAIGELDAHKDAGTGDGSDLEEKTSEDRDPGASTSHDNDHDDVTYRVQNIVVQLKRKVAQKGSMRTVFREYDANHDGSISRDEFRDALNNLNLRVTDKELDALLSLVDSHHTDNQEIMYDDFCAKFGDEQQELGEFSLRRAPTPFRTSPLQSKRRPG